MNQKWTFFLYPFLLLLWAGFMGSELYKIARRSSEIASNRQGFELVYATLNSNSAKILSLANDARARTHELEFLQGIFNFLPASEGFLRTQKALLEEVQDLRKKIGNRLKGNIHILVDTKTNKLFLKEGMTLLLEADCSVGRGGILTDKVTGRKWEFITPRGKFRVLTKIVDPVWTKPDWAFTEVGETPPPPGDPSRRVKGELGAYVLNLGDGYLIHGTRNEQMLGRAASHGCVRLGAENLKMVFEKTPLGTEVYIY